MQAVHPVERPRVRFPEPARHPEPGVVDQQFEPGFGGDAEGDTLDLPVQGEIGPEGFGGGQLAGQMFQTVGAARHQDQAIPFPVEAPGELLPDAAGSSGDDGRPGAFLHAAPYRPVREADQVRPIPPAVTVPSIASPAMRPS